MIDDRVITLDLLADAKEEVSAYARACNEAATPELRQILARQLQQAEQAQQRIFQFAKQKGYYNPYDAPEQLLANDLRQAGQLLQQINQQL
ncbi:MAG: spore coat protein [Clostridia bacterium]|nr:spore coat protein [Clostridia bacterium]